MIALTDESVERFSRQLLLPEIGGEGQKKLAAAKVLLVGVGGLGCPAALYLSAAGVGTLGLVDNDPVELSNLHRQILHHTSDIGRPKVLSAKAKLTAINPQTQVAVHRQRLTPENAAELIRPYDVVLDGSDNFDTRYLVNDTCVALNKPLVSGAVLQWEGQVTTVLPGVGHCYRCLFPDPPEADCVRSCSEAGIVGPVAGVIGSLMAVETLKVILQRPTLVNRLALFNFLTMSFRTVPAHRHPTCSACAA